MLQRGGDRCFQLLLLHGYLFIFCHKPDLFRIQGRSVIQSELDVGQVHIVLPLGKAVRCQCQRSQIQARLFRKAAVDSLLLNGSLHLFYVHAFQHLGTMDLILDVDIHGLLDFFPGNGLVGDNRRLRTCLNLQDLAVAFQRLVFTDDAVVQQHEVAHIYGSLGIQLHVGIDIAGEIKMLILQCQRVALVILIGLHRNRKYIGCKDDLFRRCVFEADLLSINCGDLHITQIAVFLIGALQRSQVGTQSGVNRYHIAYFQLQIAVISKAAHRQIRRTDVALSICLIQSDAQGSDRLTVVNDIADFPHGDELHIVIDGQIQDFLFIGGKVEFPNGFALTFEVEPGIVEGDPECLAQIEAVLAGDLIDTVGTGHNKQICLAAVCHDLHLDGTLHLFRRQVGVRRGDGNGEVTANIRCRGKGRRLHRFHRPGLDVTGVQSHAFGNAIVFRSQLGQFFIVIPTGKDMILAVGGRQRRYLCPSGNRPAGQRIASVGFEGNLGSPNNDRATTGTTAAAGCLRLGVTGLALTVIRLGKLYSGAGAGNPGFLVPHGNHMVRIHAQSRCLSTAGSVVGIEADAVTGE